MRHPAVAADQHRPARQAAVVDVAGEVPVDPGEAGGVQPDLERLDLDYSVRHVSSRAPDFILAGGADRQPAVDNIQV
ncbi:hypothetical protein GCM10009539_38380 [Cryptosporangium japonicum]|uniref:Uncharacterized protein n=1 Tax=Cryptosporangium japonicum TaxID=80872 RepID=A0ABP3E535_9ACTN